MMIKHLELEFGNVVKSFAEKKKKKRKYKTRMFAQDRRKKGLCEQEVTSRARPLVSIGSRKFPRAQMTQATANGARARITD